MNTAGSAEPVNTMSVIAPAKTHFDFCKPISASQLKPRQQAINVAMRQMLAAK